MTSAVIISSLSQPNDIKFVANLLKLSYENITYPEDKPGVSFEEIIRNYKKLFI